MGVRVTNYVIWGVCLRDRNLLICQIQNRLEEYEEKYKCLDFVNDGMNGDYIIIGKIVHETKEEDPFFDQPTSIDDFKITKKEQKEIKKEIDQLIYDYNAPTLEYKHWFISHYH